MRFIVVALFLGAVLNGCARIPEPATYLYTNQEKMQSGHHWDILAGDVANEINNTLILGDHLNTPVYVRETCGDDNTPCDRRSTSLFNETFRDLLITNLVSLGVPTSSTPTQDGIEVKYKAQQVYHHKKRLRTWRPGTFTSLAAEIIAFKNAPWEIAMLASAGALDYANVAYASTSHFEVVITTSMSIKNKYLYRNTNIYYINDRDSWHYNTTTAPTEIALTSGTAPLATPDEPAHGRNMEESPPVIPEIPETSIEM